MTAAAYFTLGFVLGSGTASVLVVIIVTMVTSGKFLDMQDRIDELELRR